MTFRVTAHHKCHDSPASSPPSLAATPPPPPRWTRARWLCGCRWTTRTAWSAAPTASPWCSGWGAYTTGEQGGGGTYWGWGGGQGSGWALRPLRCALHVVLGTLGSAPATKSHGVRELCGGRRCGGSLPRAVALAARRSSSTSEASCDARRTRELPGLVALLLLTWRTHVSPTRPNHPPGFQPPCLLQPRPLTPKVLVHGPVDCRGRGPQERVPVRQLRLGTANETWYGNWCLARLLLLSSFCSPCSEHGVDEHITTATRVG